MEKGLWGVGFDWIGEDNSSVRNSFLHQSFWLGPTGFGGFQIVRDVFNITDDTIPEQDYACFFKGYEKKERKKKWRSRNSDSDVCSAQNTTLHNNTSLYVCSCRRGKRLIPASTMTELVSPEGNRNFHFLYFYFLKPSFTDEADPTLVMEIIVYMDTSTNNIVNACHFVHTLWYLLRSIQSLNDVLKCTWQSNKLFTWL